jgi:hypothetical protein
MRPGIAAICVVLAFAFLYDLRGNVGYTTDPTQGALCLSDALVYSVAAFVSFGFSDFAALSFEARVLTVIESALGLVLLALLFFTIGNRISRS